MTTPEGRVVQELIRMCDKFGWPQRKVAYEGYVGAPDRMVIAPGRLFFVECKAPGKKPAPVQAREHDRIRHGGVQVYVCDSEESVRYVFNHVRALVREAAFKPAVGCRHPLNEETK